MDDTGIILWVLGIIITIIITYVFYKKSERGLETILSPIIKPKQQDVEGSEEKNKGCSKFLTFIFIGVIVFILFKICASPKQESSQKIVKEKAPVEEDVKIPGEENVPLVEEESIFLHSPTIFRDKGRALSKSEADSIVSNHPKFIDNLNKPGKKFDNKFGVYMFEGYFVVIDTASSLMWQQGGSNTMMTYEYARGYIENLNGNRFASFNDWRLPTLDEAISLGELESNKDSLFIDPSFNKQDLIWTADSVKYDSPAAWVVDFTKRQWVRGYFDYGRFYVRAVRSLQSLQQQF